MVKPRRARDLTSPLASSAGFPTNRGKQGFSRRQTRYGLASHQCNLQCGDEVYVIRFKPQRAKNRRGRLPKDTHGIGPKDRRAGARARGR